MLAVRVRIIGRTLNLVGFALSGAVLLAAPPARGDTITFTTDTTIDDTNFTHDGDDIIVQGCTLTINGTHAFNSLIVERNGANQAGVVTHTAAFTNGATNGCFLTVSGDANVQGAAGTLVGSRIDVSGRGYPAGQGPGVGSPVANGSGGGYGGAGGSSNTSLGGGTYGSVMQPTDLGSGAGNYHGGGGVVRLTVQGVLTVEAGGAINADGDGGSGGGGSGGSVWLTCGTLAGAGLVTANGGDCGIYASGGGGGGRIALYNGVLTMPLANIRAYGGGGYGRGGAGTLYVQPDGVPRGTIYIDNGGQAGENTEFYGDTTLDADVVISGEGRLGPARQDSALHLTVTGDVTVESSGYIWANGRGYPAGQGPGVGSPVANGSGGGYGGSGGRDNCGTAGGGTYGSVMQPVDLGSGASYWYAGGGVVRLTVQGVLTVEAGGAINADGDGGSGGGGSGGSVWLTCGTLAGAGLVTANGGDCGPASSGGGGGGRIALYNGVLTMPLANIRAYGGGGYGRGGAGTVYRQVGQSRGTLSVDNAGLGGARTPIPPGTYQFNVQCTGRAVLEFPIGVSVAANQSFVADGASQILVAGDLTVGGQPGASAPLTVSDGAVITVESGQTWADELHVENGGTLVLNTAADFAVVNVSSGGILTHTAGTAGMDLRVIGDMSVAAGGLITADARGFASGTGPGAGTCGGYCSGAGYGGHGGAAYGGPTGGPTYGSASSPVDLGSGGGGAGGGGGGALRLSVGGTLSIEGSLTARGGDGLSGSTGGGGSGGSIWLAAGILTGTGTLLAQGGDGASSYAGGGGGGRIAIHTVCEPLISRDQVQVRGGTGYERGADGTVYWSILPDVLPGTCGVRYYVDPAAAGGAGDGSNWANAFLTLQDALQAAAQLSSDCAEVWVAANTYVPTAATNPPDSQSASFVLLGGVQLYGGFEGLNSAHYPGGETLREQRDPTAHPTVLSGDLAGNDPDTSDNAYHVVTTSGWEVPAVLDGFLITAGVADGADSFGGGLYSTPSRFRIANTVVSGNSAADEGGGNWGCCSTAYIANMTLGANAAPHFDLGVIRDFKAVLEGDLHVGPGTLEVQSTLFEGGGMLHLSSGTLVEITGSQPGARATTFRTNVLGQGDIHIAPTQTLWVQAGALVDLSGGEGGGCADPQTSENWGQITVEGGLEVENASIANTKVIVTLGGLSNASTIYNNNVTMCESAPGFGGEFFVAGDSTIQCNVITSYGDRYLDLDPDPLAVPRPTITQNKFYVAILQGTQSAQGELLELRTPDYDYGVGGGVSGAYQLASSPGYSDTWVLERLEVLPSAKVNLTNRQGFVFQDPNLSLPEALYVKELKLHPNAVLNTGLQRLYYQSLVDENGQPLGPDPNDLSAPLANGSRLVDVPLLGFSLKVIALEDDTEFGVRVRTRVTDPADPNPPPPAAPTYLGAIERVAAPVPGDPNNHALQMRTRAPDALSASSVAAHGSFARAGEDEILIEFQYRFCDNPAAELIVYLSDSPEPRDPANPDPVHSVEVARVYPPAPGRRGSIGSAEFATFFGNFPKGELNFTRGTYVELELRGQDACLLIDDWDPQILCSQTCHDLNGNNGVSNRDFMLLLAECGREGTPGKWCLDSKLNFDQYVDLDDLLAWDGMLTTDPPPENLCRPQPCDGGTGTPVSGLPTSGLLVAGKPNGAGVQRDWLYACDPDGGGQRTALAPADYAPDGNHRGNGRLVPAPDGTLYQLHASQGLIRLDTAAHVVGPGNRSFAGKTVYVGVTSTGDTGSYPTHYQNGLPLLDAAFSPSDPNVIYVTPVVVKKTTPSVHYYKAAARLQLAGSSYNVTQLYGNDPLDDSCTHTIPPNVSECQLQSQREIEVDDQGNVYVLSALALNDNNWLAVYDEASGSERVRRLLTDLQPLLRSPSALLLSTYDPNYLYLTSALHLDPNDVQTHLYRCQIERAAGAVTNVTLVGDVAINNPVGVGYGYGYTATIQALAEDATSGELFAVGFTLPKVEENLSVNSPLYQQLFCDNCPLYSLPTLARVPFGSPGPLSATAFSVPDLAWPLSVVFLGRGLHPGDLNCDGWVNFDDINPFVLALSDPASYQLVFPNCNVLNGDCNGDGEVNFDDINPFVGILSGGP